MAFGRWIMIRLVKIVVLSFVILLDAFLVPSAISIISHKKPTTALQNDTIMTADEEDINDDPTVENSTTTKYTTPAAPGNEEAAEPTIETIYGEMAKEVKETDDIEEVIDILDYYIDALQVDEEEKELSTFRVGSKVTSILFDSGEIVSVDKWRAYDGTFLYHVKLPDGSICLVAESMLERY